VSGRGLVADRVERNCSVVGNDSSMRSARLGRIIDRADAVYRMNFAPVRTPHIVTSLSLSCSPLLTPSPRTLRLPASHSPPMPHLVADSRTAAAAAILLSLPPHLDTRPTMLRWGLRRGGARMAWQLLDYSDAVGLRTYTQCINPEKLRLLTRTNAEFTLDTGERPRVMVVGDADGSDPITGAKGPCLDYSPGGTCVKRTLGDRPKVSSLSCCVSFP